MISTEQVKAFRARHLEASDAAYRRYIDTANEKHLDALEEHEEMVDIADLALAQLERLDYLNSFNGLLKKIEEFKKVGDHNESACG